ncbi:hypothetical protein D3C80_2167960 [compost metagenome]
MVERLVFIDEPGFDSPFQFKEYAHIEIWHLRLILGLALIQGSNTASVVPLSWRTASDF